MDAAKTPALTGTGAGDDVLALIDEAQRCLGIGDARGALAALEHVLRVIASKQHGPEPDTATTPPAPRVRIRTLGGFAVTVDGQPLHVGRKLPRRPLELLKAIIVFGGRQIPQDTLADALWPGFDGDHAHNALTAALHRLRYLLRVPGALVVCNGRVTLHSAKVKVDAFDADTLMRDLQSVSPVRGSGVDALLALYRGPFLPDELHVPWTDRMRERLRQRFCACIADTATGLERAGRIGDAHSLYRRAVAADDDCAPRLHDGVLRCAQQIDTVHPPRPWAHAFATPAFVLAAARPAITGAPP